MKLHLIERDRTGQVTFETDLEYQDQGIPHEVANKITKYYEDEDSNRIDRDRLESLRESIIDSIGEDEIGKVLSSISPIEDLLKKRY